MRRTLIVSILLLAAVTVSTCAAQQATAVIKFADFAKRKATVKSKNGTLTEWLVKAGSKHVIVLNTPGIDPKTFTGDTEFRYAVQEQSGTGNFLVTFKFNQDPKYVPGAASVKVKLHTVLTFLVPDATFGTANLKIGKDSITLSINHKFLSLYASKFLNTTAKGAANLPAGKGSKTIAFRATVSVGDVVASVETVSYTGTYSNKTTTKGTPLWSGSSKGSATGQ